MIPPATREIALKAMRLARRGNKGKAIATKLGLANAVEANRLADQGFLIHRDERSKLTEAELLCIRLIDVAELRHAEAGITGSVKSWDVDRMARRSLGWCGRTVNRRLAKPDRNDDWSEPRPLGLVWHSRNGHCGLTGAGRALAHVLRDVPPHILAKWGLRS